MCRKDGEEKIVTLQGQKRSRIYSAKEKLTTMYGLCDCAECRTKKGRKWAEKRAEIIKTCSIRRVTPNWIKNEIFELAGMDCTVLLRYEVKQCVLRLGCGWDPSTLCEVALAAQ